MRRPALPADPRWRAAATAALAVAALVVIGQVWSRLQPEPSGPRSSSYATARAGAAAWADLLARRGRQVTRVRRALHAARLDPESTVVVLDPGFLLARDRRALARFVGAGGRLVAGGDGVDAIGDALVRAAPRRDPDGPGRADPLAPVAEAVGPVATAGQGSWSRAGEALPVLGDRHSALLVLARRGRGTAALLADASPVQNRLLARGSNAALALALAPRGRPVAFVESVHGFGTKSGLAALPGDWKAALIGFALAALVLLAAYGRRLGPPEAPDAPAAPPRRAYVDALGATLGRLDDPAAVAEPLRARARRAVLARAGLASTAAADDVETAARRQGLEDDEARVVATGATGATGREDLLTAGRALARTRRGGA